MKNIAFCKGILLILLVFCTLAASSCSTKNTTVEPQSPSAPVPSASNATDATPDFSNFAMDLSDETGKAGDEITVTLNMTDNPSIAGYSVTVVYNPEVLTFVTNENKVSGGFATVNSKTEGRVRVMCTVMGGNKLSTNGPCDVLTFKINENAPAGTSTLDLILADKADVIYVVAGDNTMPSVPCKLSGGSVTVQ